MRDGYKLGMFQVDGTGERRGSAHLLGTSSEARDDLALHGEREGRLGPGVLAHDTRALLSHCTTFSFPLAALVYWCWEERYVRQCGGQDSRARVCALLVILI